MIVLLHGAAFDEVFSLPHVEVHKGVGAGYEIGFGQSGTLDEDDVEVATRRQVEVARGHVGDGIVEVWALSLFRQMVDGQGLRYICRF